MLVATQIRVGMIIRHGDEPCRVVDIVHVTPGKGRGMVQAKMKNIRSGSNVEYRFRSDERVEKIQMEENEMEFLYESDNEYYFMNLETYDQIQLPKDLLGEAVQFLVPNNRVTVQFLEGSPLGIILPLTVDLKVVETVPGMKGATATNSPKPATLETGIVVQVPQFINEGETIRVDTSTGKYLERA